MWGHAHMRYCVADRIALACGTTRYDMTSDHATNLHHGYDTNRKPGAIPVIPSFAIY